MLVDAAIAVYGKPYQTAVTVLTLLEQSGSHIDRLYYCEEGTLPENDEVSALELLAPVAHRLTLHHSKFYYGNKYHEIDLEDEEQRLSLRYQYPFENSDKQFLFVSHNDVLYQGDLVGAFLQMIGSHGAIGEIGQCWNCPAQFARKCGDGNYLNYRPDTREYEDVHRSFPPPRRGYAQNSSSARPWPLPECRVNEWFCLINLAVTRPLTYPLGSALPFGSYRGVDLGTRWFFDLAHQGVTFKHHWGAPLARHCHFSRKSGYETQLDQELYRSAEQGAKAYLQSRQSELIDRILRAESIFGE